MVLGVGNSVVTATCAAEDLSLKDILPDLPFELIWKILEHFSIRQLKELCLVSKRWKATIRSDESVYFKHYNLLKDFFKPQNIATYDLDITAPLSPDAFKAHSNDSRALTVKFEHDTASLLRVHESEIPKEYPTLSEALELFSSAPPPKEIFAHKNGYQFSVKEGKATLRMSWKKDFQEVQLEVPHKLVILSLKTQDAQIFEHFSKAFNNTSIIFACFTDEMHLIVVHKGGFVSEWKIEKETLKCSRFLLVQEDMSSFYFDNIRQVTPFGEFLILRRFKTYELFNPTTFTWKTILTFDLVRTLHTYLMKNVLYSLRRASIEAYQLTTEGQANLLWRQDFSNFAEKFYILPQCFIAIFEKSACVYEIKTGELLNSIKFFEFPQKFLLGSNFYFLYAQNKAQLHIYHLPSGLPFNQLDLTVNNSDFKETVCIEGSPPNSYSVMRPLSTISQIEINQEEIFILYQKRNTTLSIRLMMISRRLPFALCPTAETNQKRWFSKLLYLKRQEDCHSRISIDVFKRCEINR